MLNQWERYKSEDRVTGTKSCKTMKAWEIGDESLCRSVGSAVSWIRGKAMLQLCTFGKGMLPTPASAGMCALQMKGDAACLLANLCFQIGKTMGEVTKGESPTAVSTAATQQNEKHQSAANVA